MIQKYSFETKTKSMTNPKSKNYYTCLRAISITLLISLNVLLALNLLTQVPGVYSSIRNPGPFVLNRYEGNSELADLLMDLTVPSSEEKNHDYLPAPEMIRAAGYPSESHTVVTEDGYILTMHRIPHGKVNGSGPGDPKRVIFLQHGLFGTSADWLLNSVEKCLAYMLADQGYDVWLGNARGNEYSSNHTHLSPKSFKFWRFSWHEMGYYDLPAELDYVMNVTGHSNLYYTGHSMGTTMFFVLTTTRPEYNTKIRVMAALGPAVYLSHTKSAIKYFAKYWGRAEKMLLDIVGHGILFPKYIVRLIHYFAPDSCTPEMEIATVCEWVIALVAGFDPAQFNYTLLPTILSHEPSTESSQTTFHYFQNIRSGEFRMYDPGFNHPQPEYDLSKVTLPIALFWGPNDAICVPEDVAILAKKLPNLALNHRVNFTEFNHVDFIFAKDADVLVNRPLIEFLRKY